MKSNLYLAASFAGAITARQEQIEWWLRNGAAVVAIAAGLVAIWTKVRTRRSRAREDRPPLD